MSIGYGYKADVWAFGVLLFQLFAGRTPFYDSDPMIMYSNITSCKVNWCPNMPATLKDLIINLLLESEEERYTLNKIKAHTFYSVRL